MASPWSPEKGGGGVSKVGHPAQLTADPRKARSDAGTRIREALQPRIR